MIRRRWWLPSRAPRPSRADQVAATVIGLGLTAVGASWVYHDWQGDRYFERHAVTTTGTVGPCRSNCDAPGRYGVDFFDVHEQRRSVALSGEPRPAYGSRVEIRYLPDRENPEAMLASEQREQSPWPVGMAVLSLVLTVVAARTPAGDPVAREPVPAG